MQLDSDKKVLELLLKESSIVEHFYEDSESESEYIGSNLKIIDLGFGVLLSHVSFLTHFQLSFERNPHTPKKPLPTKYL